MTDYTSERLRLAHLHLTNARKQVDRLEEEVTSPELEEVKRHITDALDALRRHGHDGRWSE